MDSDLLTIPEAAAVLKVSPVTISRWLKQGRLTAYRMGPRAVRIRRDDLTEVLKPSGHAESATPDETDAGVGHDDGSGDGIVRVALTAPAMRAGERLAAVQDAEGLRERILARRKGVHLPLLEPERAKDKRGKRS